MRPDVTFSAETWVWLELRGESRGTILTRNDNGLAHEFLLWLGREGIPYRAQSTGGGCFYGRIPLANWPKVLAWLLEKKLRRVPQS